MKLPEKNITRRRVFRPERLVVVRPAPEHAPTLLVGDRVRLRSGGPVLLVLEVGDEETTVGWCDDVPQERCFPTICLEIV